MQESKSCALPLGDSPTEKGGYRDSNPGPPEPQSGALTNCAIPTIKRTSLKGFEPPTHGLEGRCSIRLSYRLMLQKAGDGNRTHVSSLEGWCSTIELHPHILYEIVIGVTRFELATPCSQSRCSSQTEPHPGILFPKTQSRLYYLRPALSIPNSDYFSQKHYINFNSASGCTPSSRFRIM